jgi:signal transduction histidine kinase/ActR/RegA family two-component response regulator
VVHEYGVLRHAIMETAEQVGMPLSIGEYDAVSGCLNGGIAEAAHEYVRVREQQLTSRQSDLQFLIEAGELLGSSLDYPSTMASLTQLLVPRLGDFCVVRMADVELNELPVAHRDPQKIELLREVLRRCPDALHSHAPALRTGEPVLVEARPEGLFERMARSPEDLMLLQRLGARSWVSVPLHIKRNVIGTITLVWAESERRYSAADVLLVNDLARRAASAIDNAQLYELARLERARAEAATRAKDEFVAVVTHELRAPLNVIIGWMRLLRGGALPKKTRAHALEVVERNANAQSQLVSDLLDISRVLTGRVRLEPAQVDLGNLLTLVLEDARFAIETKRLQLHVTVPEQGTLMRGDGERLKQMIWNLLLNAVKFTPKGGQIWVLLRRVESDLELSVSDNGIGIAPEFLPHVFDSFRQYDSKTTRPHGGLGIGLSITKHLIDLHGGSIEVRSDGAGLGASFRVRLPLSPVISTTVGVSKVPAATTSSHPPGLPRHEALAGSSVLIVDDEDDARELLRVILEARDMHVHDAGSVPEALSLLEHTAVDVIVSDIGMPDQDGYAFIRAVRALPNEQVASTPAVALTAFTRNEDRARALLDGFNVHLGKPVEPAELLATLAGLVQHAARLKSGDDDSQPQ